MIRGIRRRWFSIALWAFTITAPISGQDKAEAPIYTSGFGDPSKELISIPLTIGSKSIKVVFDTGTDYTLVDRSLLDELKCTEILPGKESVSGLDLEFCRTTNVTVGELIRGDPILVAVADLRVLRSAIDTNVFAVMGLNLIKEHRWKIDFSERVIHAFSSDPLAHDQYRSSARIPLLADPRADEFRVVAEVEERSSFFLLDTGQSVLSLKYAEFDRLAEIGAIEITGYGTFTTVGTASERRMKGILNAIRLGRVRLENIEVSSGPENSIGLNLLREFVVDLDFPNREMRLQVQTTD